MKKIEDLAGSGTKYAGVKVRFEGWSKNNTFLTIIFCGEKYVLGNIRGERGESCLSLDFDYFIYEEPKPTKEVAAFVLLSNTGKICDERLLSLVRDSRA